MACTGPSFGSTANAARKVLIKPEFMSEVQREQSVLITGCSSGFGELTAKTLALAGHYVFATMRDVEGRNQAAARDLKEWAQARRLRMEVLELDVTQDESVNSAVAEAISRAGRIDVVVNNAGASARGPLEAFSIEEMQALFNLNAFGPMRVDKAVLPSMRKRGFGLLIHVTSTLGRVLAGGGGLYPATKWAAEGLAESLHYQVKPFGVDVIILEPGSFPTPATGKSQAASGEAITREYEALAPPRGGSINAQENSQDVADAIEHLIAMPAGQRPLRTVVGGVYTEGVAEYNDFYEQTKAHLYATLSRAREAAEAAQGAVAS
jgi:NAD(P)-dependent dehydrogenase (short-subunit alcohol dehydrogenase family)